MASGAEHWARVEHLEALGAAGDARATAELAAVVADESGRECRHTLVAAIDALARPGRRS